MSAWGIGATNATRHGSGVRPAGADPASEQSLATVDTLVTWIPGEVIAAYAAVVLALQPVMESDAATPPPIKITSGWWLIIAIIFAGVLTFLAGWSKTKDLKGPATRELTARVIFAGVAFAIWSVVVPGSWWYSIDSFAENPEVVTIGAGILGAVFALVAEGVVRRIGG